MGGLSAPLAPHMSHEHVYMHTGTSVNQAEHAGGAVKEECRRHMNIVASLKDIVDASRVT